MCKRGDPDLPSCSWRFELEISRAWSGADPSRLWQNARSILQRPRIYDHEYTLPRATCCLSNVVFLGPGRARFGLCRPLWWCYYCSPAPPAWRTRRQPLRCKFCCKCLRHLLGAAIRRDTAHEALLYTRSLFLTTMHGWLLVSHIAVICQNSRWWLSAGVHGSTEELHACPVRAPLLLFRSVCASPWAVPHLSGKYPAEDQDLSHMTVGYFFCSMMCSEMMPI